jgi:uncharacterized protein YdaU (DUF1376 family)
MSKSEHWFPLYVGDYLADTGHLSTSEHGAYLLLLMHQWRNGCIPDDERQLTKITRTTTREWRAISATVLAFFDCGESGLQQGRLERVRAEQAEKRQRLSEAGRKAGKASAAQRSFNDRSTIVNQGLVEPSCNQPEPEPEPEREDTSLRSVSLPRGKRAGGHPDFADFWEAYPRKVGKGAAEKAFAAAVAKGASVADIAAGLNRQRWPADVQYIPHPATWLNGRRWEDDPGAAAPPPAQSEPASKMDWLWRDMAREAEAAEDFPDFTKGFLQ